MTEETEVTGSIVKEIAYHGFAISIVQWDGSDKYSWIVGEEGGEEDSEEEGILDFDTVGDATNAAIDFITSNYPAPRS